MSRFVFSSESHLLPFFFFCLRLSRLPFADFLNDKSFFVHPQLRVQFVTVSYILYLFFSFFLFCKSMLCFRSASPVAYSSKRKTHFYHRLWNESFTVLWAERAPGVSNRGMFMLSIKGWVVIKTHFFLNECKLAHLLWWASCPDSSISMIDQLSSCWWLTGNGSRENGWGWKGW